MPTPAIICVVSCRFCMAVRFTGAEIPTPSRRVISAASAGSSRMLSISCSVGSSGFRPSESTRFSSMHAA